MAPDIGVRKSQLRLFYEKHDAGRIKNIDPIFTRWTYEEISSALKAKYGILPPGWGGDPYQQYRDLAKSGVPKKKIQKAMVKAGLDPKRLFGSNIDEDQNKLQRPMYDYASVGKARNLTNVLGINKKKETGAVVEASVPVVETLPKAKEEPRPDPKTPPPENEAAIKTPAEAKEISYPDPKTPLPEKEIVSESLPKGEEATNPDPEALPLEKEDAMETLAAPMPYEKEEPNGTRPPSPEEEDDEKRKLEQEKVENERLKREEEEEEKQRALEQENIEKKRLKREEEEKQRKLEQEKMEEERLKREDEQNQRKLEQEKLEQEKMEKERLKREDEEKQRKLEQEKLERKKTEKERLKREEKAKQRMHQQEKLEQEKKKKAIEQKPVATKPPPNKSKFQVIATKKEAANAETPKPLIKAEKPKPEKKSPATKKSMEPTAGNVAIANPKAAMKQNRMSKKIVKGDSKSRKSFLNFGNKKKKKPSVVKGNTTKDLRKKRLTGMGDVSSNFGAFRNNLAVMMDPGSAQKPKEKPRPQNINGGVSNKFAGIHLKLARQMGGAEDVAATKDKIERQKGEVSKKFGDAHAKLGALFGAPAGAPAKPKAAAKPKEGLKKFGGGNKDKKWVSVDDPALAKYKKMQKMRLPEGAIMNAMEKDGFNPDCLLNPSQGPPAGASGAGASAPKAAGLKKFGGGNQNKKSVPIDDPGLDKYKKMKKMRLPEGAIRNAMEKDGFDPECLFNPKVTPAAAATPTSAAASQPQQLQQQPMMQQPMMQQPMMQQPMMQQPMMQQPQIVYFPGQPGPNGQPGQPIPMMMFPGQPGPNGEPGQPYYVPYYQQAQQGFQTPGQFGYQ